MFRLLREDFAFVRCGLRFVINLFSVMGNTMSCSVTLLTIVPKELVGRCWRAGCLDLRASARLSLLFQLGGDLPAV